MKRLKVQYRWLQTWVLGKTIPGLSLTDSFELVDSMVVGRASVESSASQAAPSARQRRVVGACSSAVHVGDRMAEAFVVPDSTWR